MYDITKKNLYIVFDGVNFRLVYDGVVVNNDFPFGILGEPTGKKVKASGEIISDIAFSVEISKAKYYRKTEVLDRKLNFYTPNGHNNFIGDVVNFYRSGIYHLLYMPDRHHHANRWGCGGHRFEHMITRNFIDWEDVGPIWNVTEQWQSAGTGTMFFHNGKYYAAYGLHTDRTMPRDRVCNREIAEYAKSRGETKTITYEELKKRGMYPSGANYSVSSDGVHFTCGEKVFSSCENPSIFFKPDKEGYYTYDKNADWAKDLEMDDRIYYPTIRQFRVSVCTSLYRQQIPLHYIRKHMNHLSEDMAAYYIRPQKNLEKEYSETIYRAVFKDGSKMLGTNGDAFVQKINEFIEQNHMNIQNDMEGVIQAVARKFPLRSKVGGMCIRCGEVIPCASNNSTDVIYCAFGMCPNHCHMFFMADISYEEYLQNRDTAQYNKDNGYKKAYQKELNKLKYIIEHSLMPELTMLEDELERHGEEDILEKYPQLTYIVNHLDSIKQEVQTWM